MNIRKLKRQANTPSRYETASKPKNLTPRIISSIFQSNRSSYHVNKSSIITTVIQKAKILKDAKFEPFKSLSNISIYCDLHNINSLKTELRLWRNTKDTSSLKIVPKSNGCAVNILKMF